MLPGVGTPELVVIAVVALLVVGPKDLPVMLRKLGQFIAKMRGLAAEFRTSFDEMARQSELDELRKEVDALREGRFADPYRPDLEGHMREIDRHMSGYDDSNPNMPALSTHYEDAALDLHPQAPAPLLDYEEPEPELPFDAPPASHAKAAPAAPEQVGAKA